MARTELTVQNISRTGLEPTYSAANVDGHAFNNASGRIFLHILNTGGAACTVTIVTPITVDGKDVPDQTFSVQATTGDKLSGPFPAAVYNQVDSTLSIDKAVWVGYSATSGVTVAAIKLPGPSYS